jgi:ABC-type glutathione transport system ATPase component
MQLSAQLQQQVQPVLLPCQHVPAQCRLQCHSPQQQHTLSRRRHHYQQQRGTTLAAAAGAAAAGDGSTRGQKWRQRQQQQQQQQQQGQQQPGPPPRPSPPPIADASSVPPEGLADLFKAYATQLQAMQQQPDAGAGAGSTPGANVLVQNVSFHPPGSEHPLLDGVDFQLAPNQLGLVIGRSGSGKTTLLQLLAGLTEQTGGNIFIHRPTPDDHAPGLFLPTHIEQRMQQVWVGCGGVWDGCLPGQRHAGTGLLAARNAASACQPATRD